MEICVFCRGPQLGFDHEPGCITRGWHVPTSNEFADRETRVVNKLTGGEKGSKVERFDLIPAGPLKDIAKVYGYGCVKYAPRNWEKGYDWGLSYAALQRHLHAFWNGEDIDTESGLPHLAHAAWHCIALMEWAKTHPELDDRSKPPINAKRPDTGMGERLQQIAKSLPSPSPMEFGTYKPVHKDEILMNEDNRTTNRGAYECN